jgi:hypothetical protein
MALAPIIVEDEDYQNVYIGNINVTGGIVFFGRREWKCVQR